LLTILGKFELFPNHESQEKPFEKSREIATESRGWGATRDTRKMSALLCSIPARKLKHISNLG
jgi:hypothetical protein